MMPSSYLSQIRWVGGWGSFCNPRALATNTLQKRPKGAFWQPTNSPNKVSCHAKLQGYLYEPDVVWELLASVNGDTQLVDANLRPFAPHADMDAAEVARVAAAAAATQEVGGAAGEDADFALAMQLHQEEEARVREEARLRHEALERQEAEAERRRAEAEAAARAGRRPSAAAAPAVGKKSKECVVM
jgi:hypothetical protein